jgi:DNA-directed RNA polymerase subunit RPC12/RpoP
MPENLGAKGPGDPETWGVCLNDPGDPRSQENHYLCSVCGEDIWTDDDLDDESIVLCRDCWDFKNL